MKADSVLTWWLMLFSGAGGGSNLSKPNHFISSFIQGVQDSDSYCHLIVMSCRTQLQAGSASSCWGFSSLCGWVSLLLFCWTTWNTAMRAETLVHVTNYYTCYYCFRYKTNTECCLKNNLQDCFVVQCKWMNMRVEACFTFWLRLWLFLCR